MLLSPDRLLRLGAGAVELSLSQKISPHTRAWLLSLLLPCLRGLCLGLCDVLPEGGTVPASAQIAGHVMRLCLCRAR